MPSTATAHMLLLFLVSIRCACVHGWLNGIHKGFNEIFRESSRNIFLEDITDYEIIYLSHDKFQLDSEIKYELKAFGSEINLRLQPNSHLMSPHFSAILRDGNDSRLITRGDETDRQQSCYYLHVDDEIAAAVSMCQENQMEGLLFLPNATLEIHPLPPSSDNENLRPHIVRRAERFVGSVVDDPIYLRPSEQTYRMKRHISGSKKLTIEAALFLDEPAYKIFAPFFNYDDKKLSDMLLAYINGVQAIYHHPSLGKAIDIVLVKMEIFKKQPEDLPHYNGERNQLLDSFCLYNEKHNAKGDGDPKHWDMGLYISGLNFFAYENGRRSDATMGLATVNGVCTEKYNCIIAEFGATNVFGKPYPSAGFTSVYILAHEMGHNIGMHHDSTGNACPKEGFIMSPSRGTNGETIWSSCSASIASSMVSAPCLLDSPKATPKTLDHSEYNSNPGQIWRAKMQCEILIRDHDAELYNPDKLQDICENLQCKTPHRSGFYFAGPALQGTDCGPNKWCQAGLCVHKPLKAEKRVKGGWGDWIPVGECSSMCLKNSRGYQPRKRSCDKPKPVNTDEGCEGPSYEVLLCKDDKICEETKRKSVKEYATERCQNFSQILPDLDGKESGLQASHEPDRLWMACAIFCKRKDNKMYYTPRLELNDLGSNPYFPEGTWCHNDGVSDYYCIQHHCLPENFKYAKGGLAQDDVAFAQNAKPPNRKLSEEILQYLSLDQDGKPLLKALRPDQADNPSNDDWIDKDYMEIP